MNGELRRAALPSPLLAFGLTTAALLLLLLVAFPLLGPLGQTTSVALGSVVALGGLGTVVARLVPPPSDVRIGLHPPELRWLGVVLLLLPMLLWTSELDNWISLWIERPDVLQGPEAGEPTALAVLELALVTILLLPILEEFFFRGVLLQGVASVMRPLGSCLYVAALWALALPLLGRGASSLASLIAIALVEGTLLGALRIASGSLFVPIAMRIATAAVGLLLVTHPDWLPIPGFNAAGEHTPPEWLLAAALPVAAGLFLLRRAWLEREPLPELPLADEEEPGF